MLTVVASLWWWGTSSAGSTCWMRALQSLCYQPTQGQGLPPQRNTQLEEQTSYLLLIFFLSEVILWHWMSLNPWYARNLCLMTNVKLRQLGLILKLHMLGLPAVAGVIYLIFHAEHLALPKQLPITPGLLISPLFDIFLY
jgi:hypothetical protein